MEVNRHKERVREAGRRWVLIQDTALSVLGSLLAVLAVRWISEPIPSFVSLVVRWILAGIVGILTGMFISGCWKVSLRYLTMGGAAKVCVCSLVVSSHLCLAFIPIRFTVS